MRGGFAVLSDRWAAAVFAAIKVFPTPAAQEAMLRRFAPWRSSSGERVLAVDAARLAHADLHAALRHVACAKPGTYWRGSRSLRRSWRRAVHSA
jgi:hypothetical protein